MKNLLLFASAVAMATACTTTPKGYTIQGTAPDSTFNGKVAYLYDYAKDNPVDSAIVENGKFTFTGVIDTPSVFRVELARNYANIIGVNEIIDVSMDQNPASVSGKGLNGQLGTFLKETQKNMAEIRTAYDSLSKIYANNPDSFKLQFAPYQDAYESKNKQLADTYVAKNKDNMLGVYCLWSEIGEMSLTQIDSVFAQMPAAKAFKPFQTMRQEKVNEAKTAPGQKFVDFKGKDISGKEIALSDFVGKGNYVLADFWASWCGPCRGEMPNLKEIHEKYKDQGLIVLGVNVWDSKAKFDKAREEEGMTWSHLYASDNKEATKLYGINGIPQIILFAPDGTIVARDLRGQAMKDKIAEVYAKK